MEKYNEYKDSGVEWLGEIPNTWSIKRNKTIFKEISNKSEDGKGELLTVSHITGVTLRSEKSVNMFMAENFEGYKICEVGDLVINTMWAWMGALGVTKTSGICSPAYGVYRSNKEIDINPTYFNYLFTTPMYIKEMTKYSKGIVSSRLRLYPKDFYQIETSLPSLKEQTQIANFLDAKTTAIDKKVNILQKKIIHYKAYRKTLINETVNKGLDKAVKLKDSGIDWIGKIPKHWEVKRLKSLGDITTSSVNKKIEENEKLVLLVNYTDIYGNLNKEIRNDLNYMKVSAKSNQIIQKNLKKGDVLFTPSSETVEDIGVSSVVMEDLKNTLYSYHILRLRFSQKIYDNFKKYLFNNDFVQYYFSKSAKGSTRKILGLNDFNNLQIVLPPTLEEQHQIADYLDTKTSAIDSIIKNIETQITILKELRKSLINEVVTGKVKVSA